MVLVLTGTIQGEVFLLNPVVFARFHSENKLAVHKPLAVFIQQHRVDSIAERIAHAGRDKYVFVTVRVQVGDADAPGPVGFGADFVRDLGKDTVALILIKRVSENVVGCPLEKGVGPFNRTPGLAFCLLKTRGEVLLADLGLRLGHVRMHVGHEQVHQTVQVVVKKLDPHRSPGCFGKIGGGLFHEMVAVIVFVIPVVALHIEHVEIRITVLIQITERRVAAPATMLQIHLF